MDLQDDRPLFHTGRRYGYIYHTIFDHPKRGLLHYVGQHVARRIDLSYAGSGIVLNRMLKKYGWDGRVYKRIICFRSNQNTLNRAEIRFIREAKELYGPNCLNLSYVEANGKHSEETRAKMRGRVKSEEEIAAISAAQKGRSPSEETRAKMRVSGLNRVPRSEETRAKLSASLTGRKLSPEHVAKLKCRVLSEETRALISASLTGLTASDSTREKMSISGLKRGPRSEETKARMREGCKNRRKLTCNWCHKEGWAGPMTRHVDTCKSKPVPTKKQRN